MSPQQALRTAVEYAVRMAKLNGLTAKLIADCLIDVARGAYAFARR
jgi:hypothetical protein